MKILLISEENTSSHLIKSLPAANEIIVCTHPPTGEANFNLWHFAEKFGAECWSIEEERTPFFHNTIRDKKIDVLISFRSSRILKSSVLEAPLIGAFNLHTGPLPQYAGLNVASWAIFNNEKEHGVTVHWMESGIDTGAIAYQSQFSITAIENGASLTGKCVRAGAELIVNLIEDIQNKKEPPRIEQNFALRKYYSKAAPNNGWIDWSWSANKIDRFVRAAFFYPFPSPWGTPKALVNGSEIALLKTSPLTSKGDVALPPGEIIYFGDGFIDVATSKGAIRLSEVLYENERILVSNILCSSSGLAKDGNDI